LVRTFFSWLIVLAEWDLNSLLSSLPGKEKGVLPTPEEEATVEEKGRSE
jgi:hypothetical protein